MNERFCESCGWPIGKAYKYCSECGPAIIKARQRARDLERYEQKSELLPRGTMDEIERILDTRRITIGAAATEMGVNKHWLYRVRERLTRCGATTIMSGNAAKMRSWMAKHNGEHDASLP